MENSKIIEKNKNSIVLIDVFMPGENNQGKISIRGTGFITSPKGRFVTCAHVYKEIPKEELDYLGVKVPVKTDEKGIIHYRRFKARLVKFDEENDLALMEIQDVGEMQFSPITSIGDDDSVSEGDEMLFIGYPLALELMMGGYGITMSSNQCIISSVKRRGTDGSLHFFFLDTHVNNGSSGSPIFSKKDGKMIGVVSARISSKVQLPDGKVADIPANMGICRPVSYVKKLVK